MLSKIDVINKLKSRLEPLDYVYALWLEGADANGTADQYSDIDFWADIEDSQEDDAVRETENALRELSDIDYMYAVRHGHPKIRQRIYHLKETNEYLMIDFCWQLHSRPKDSYTYYKNDSIEAVKVLFDKDNIIRYTDYDPKVFASENVSLFEEMKYRYTQHSRVLKYVHRGLYLEAFAYYQRYVLEPLVALLRIIYTPAYTDYGFVHISQHIPRHKAVKHEHFTKISSLEDIAKKTEEAEQWFNELTQETMNL